MSTFYFYLFIYLFFFFFKIKYSSIPLQRLDVSAQIKCVFNHIPHNEVNLFDKNMPLKVLFMYAT